MLTPDGRIRVGGLQRVHQLAAQGVVEGVALLGAVEGDPPHSGRGLVDQDELVLVLPLAHLMALGSMSPDKRSSCFSGTPSIGVFTSPTVGPTLSASGCSASTSKS